MKKRELFLIIFLMIVISYVVYSQQSGVPIGFNLVAFDSDGDGIADNIDTDDDNDGIADVNDTVIGNSSFVQSDTVTVNVTINNSINFSRSYNGTLEVVIRDVNVILVNFSHNFSEKALNLANVTIQKEITASKCSILVRGITLTVGRTKIMYVCNEDTSIDRLCIKDAQIDKISEITSDCSGTSETAITCDGTAGSYTCTKVEGNTRYKVTGLSFTGIIEQAAPEAEEEAAPSAAGGGGGGGGGGGAGGAAPRIDFTIDKKTLKVILRQGQTKEASFSIKNTGGTIINVTTYLLALRQFIFSPSFDEIVITLNPDEDQIINLVFGAPEDLKPDVYTGEIILKSGTIEKIVNTIIEVESAKPLFDVDVEVLPEYRKIFPGEEIFIEVSLFNVRGFGRVDVILEYSITDFEGNLITKEEETVAVETQAKFVRELLVPTSVEPGDYVASVKVTFEDSVGISSDVFEVKVKTIRLYPLSLRGLTPQILAGIIVIMIIASIFLIYQFGIPKKKYIPKTREEESKVIESEEKINKYKRELAALEKAFRSKFISEQSYNNSKKRIEKELKKLGK